VIPVSFFEKAGQVHYNSVAVVDADGSVLGIYRKSHIPDGPGYEEKFYFRPGDTGFRAWKTRAGTLGVGICWDQWFPECARAMVLLGADLLLYPTAIGSEPANPSLDTRDRWQRVMQGHAVANVAPVVAANRVGEEDGQLFYGSSFVAGTDGAKVAEGSSPRRSTSRPSGASGPPGASSGTGDQASTESWVRRTAGRAASDPGYPFFGGSRVASPSRMKGTNRTGRTLRSWKPAGVRSITFNSW
jgi:hypothetical protein